MFKIQEVRELIKLIDNSNIDEFEYVNEGASIRMKKQSGEVVTYQAVPVVEQAAPAAVQAAPAPAPAAAPAPEVKEAPAAEAANLHKITSPMVGTFYASPSPEVGPYVSVGSRVGEDTVVCIVEAMKLFNEIEAEVNGEIVEVLVKNGQLVEYGQPLFLVKA
ncbi:acetyl-CoA carboxylase biotin carboxyl carrier protein [Ectobacillus ponti]|uniref:Biotin carboxyl carrier protein of acetyl-CoA carboxylase n=1 Tax=Ectobacillus ponti TaxID=2961894 RepID=A0AA41X4J0_9BACI|nr:acetyl-CoA carboxylase biotin carboxyl carrier protein [Ectobacillus ponti]MCP8967053.1 acetyl-CoA carboxylase biotin carboxyl carrier protein [Ectobacillus ponti]